MCGIAGWIDWEKDLTNSTHIIDNMIESLTPRGPDAKGKWSSLHALLGHSRLAVIDIEGGKQPMTRNFNDWSYTITYNGELYNTENIRKDLKNKGYSFKGHSDTEVLLLSYIEWGEYCLERLNGIFAFGIWDNTKQTLFLARDRMGVKPLFYTLKNNSLIFASELKAMLTHPEIPPVIDSEGLAEIFCIGPARTPGNGVFKNINELKPGNYLLLNKNGTSIKSYWKLKNIPHTDSFKRTVETVRYLLLDAITSQLVSDVPIGTLLSGGLDSSAITAIASTNLRKHANKALPTFSVDYVDNSKYFKPSAFQPNSDSPWVKKMSKFSKTNHQDIFFDSSELVNSLETAVIARDLPGMADIDSSLLLFSKKIKEKVTVALSGECADEVFGGYPWFHSQESHDAQTFPWALYPETRLNILSPEVIQKIKPLDYISSRYRDALNEVPRYSKQESKRDQRFREIGYLTLTRFMPTLLDRKDRMTMATGLEVRVPFCDHRIVDYVWNIPWEMKNFQNREKGLMRIALKGFLPEDILWRKKSPYPKTHNPDFHQKLSTKLQQIINNPSSPLLPLINKESVQRMISEPNNTSNKPWFGQLMDSSRMFAYLIQTDIWLRKYKVSII